MYSIIKSISSIKQIELEDGYYLDTNIDVFTKMKNNEGYIIMLWERDGRLNCQPFATANSLVEKTEEMATDEKLSSNKIVFIYNSPNNNPSIELSLLNAKESCYCDHHQNSCYL